MITSKHGPHPRCRCRAACVLSAIRLREDLSSSAAAQSCLTLTYLHSHKCIAGSHCFVQRKLGMLPCG